MAPIPKPADQRQRWAKRSEIGMVEAPKGDIVIPAAPPDLLKASQDRWEAYWRSAVSSAVDMNADRGLLERWIRSVDEWYRAYRAFRKERTTEGSTGQLVLSPLAKWIKQLESEISRCEQQMGLTPLSRVKLGIAAGQARMTADMLNQSLSEDDARDADDEPDAIEGEWEAV